MTSETLHERMIRGIELVLQGELLDGFEHAAISVKDLPNGFSVNNGMIVPPKDVTLLPFTVGSNDIEGIIRDELPYDVRSSLWRRGVISEVEQTLKKLLLNLNHKKEVYKKSIAFKAPYPEILDFKVLHLHPEYRPYEFKNARRILEVSTRDLYSGRRSIGYPVRLPSGLKALPKNPRARRSYVAHTLTRCSKIVEPGTSIPSAMYAKFRPLNFVFRTAYPESKLFYMPVWVAEVEIDLGISITSRFELYAYKNQIIKKSTWFGIKKFYDTKLTPVRIETVRRRAYATPTLVANLEFTGFGEYYTYVARELRFDPKSVHLEFISRVKYQL